VLHLESSRLLLSNPFTSRSSHGFRSNRLKTRYTPREPIRPASLSMMAIIRTCWRRIRIGWAVSSEATSSVSSFCFEPWPPLGRLRSLVFHLALTCSNINIEPLNLLSSDSTVLLLRRRRKLLRRGERRRTVGTRRGRSWRLRSQRIQERHPCSKVSELGPHRPVQELRLTRVTSLQSLLFPLESTTSANEEPKPLRTVQV
jgi:hypothetical protein